MRNKRSARTVLYPLMTTLLAAAAPVASAATEGCSDKLAKEFLAGWSDDMSRLLSTFTDDIVYEDIQVNALLHGKKEVQDFAQGWFNAFPDINFTLMSTIISDNHAAVVWRVNGIQKGDLPGMPASNKPVEVVGVSIMDCSDGKISHNPDYYDFATAMRQMGYLPTPAR
jgi:steroid delta-isomerase-like uncharacterized protein